MPFGIGFGTIGFPCRYLLRERMGNKFEGAKIRLFQTHFMTLANFFSSFEGRSSFLA